MTEPKKAIIHLLMPHQDGPIESHGLGGSIGSGLKMDSGGRFAVCCNPKAALPKHATGEVGAATCAKCLATPWAQTLRERTAAVESGEELRDAPADAFPEGSDPDALQPGVPKGKLVGAAADELTEEAASK